MTVSSGGPGEPGGASVGVVAGDPPPEPPDRTAWSPGDLPSIDGVFDRSDAARGAAGRDFGGLCHAPPALVLRPASTRDVAAALRWAEARGCRVAARGAGHCVGGQAQAEGGLVVAMSSLGRVLGWDAPTGGAGGAASRWVDVEAGILWRTLVEETVARGLTPPVLTDWLEMTVGGTLSLGGIGAESFRLGLQTDHVLELEVVTGHGRDGGLLAHGPRGAVRRGAGRARAVRHCHAGAGGARPGAARGDAPAGALCRPRRVPPRRGAAHGDARRRRAQSPRPGQRHGPPPPALRRRATRGGRGAGGARRGRRLAAPARGDPLSRGPARRRGRRGGPARRAAASAGSASPRSSPTSST